MFKKDLPNKPLVETDEVALGELPQTYPEYADAIASLNEKGFAIVDLGFAPEDLDAVTAFCRAKLQNVSRIQDGWLTEAAIGRLAVHQPVLDLLTKVYGRRAFPFQTLNFQVGTEQAAHSDTYHFSSSPERFMCGVWVALEDVSPDSGPLVYYPGSHKLPIIHKSEIGGTQSYPDYEKHIARLMVENAFAPEYGELKRGQALIWSANLVHGGSKRRNRDLTRLSQVTHYYFEDCAYHTPLYFDLENEKHFIRQPFDLSTRRHVISQRKHVNQRIRIRDFLAQRWKILRHRPPPF